MVDDTDIMVRRKLMKGLSIQTTYLSVFSLMAPATNDEWILSFLLISFMLVIRNSVMFWLCNYFIFLFIFFISYCSSPWRLAGAFLDLFSEKIRCWYWCSLFVVTTSSWSLLQQAEDSGCGFGGRAMWKEELDLVFQAFSSSLLFWFTGSTVKKEVKCRIECCVL